MNQKVTNKDALPREDQERQYLALMEQHRQMIYKVCYMYATNDDMQADLFQEVALNLWRAFPKFRGDSKLSTWVYRITMNTCITYLRRRTAHPQTIPITSVMGDLLPAPQERENLRELYALINRLDRLERALIMLWLDERTYEEIAEILGVSLPNVKVRIHRIKAKLKNMSNH